MPAPARALTPARFAAAVRSLAAADPDLGRIHAAHGPPPMWTRAPGFATLVLLILEQQVSLASAKAAFDRLAVRAGAVSPEAVLALDDAALRAVGFSRQKTRYVRALADAVASRALDLGRLPRLDEAAVRAELTRIPGIGEWTADIYLLMALRRPDIWPAKDLALAVAAQEVKRLAERPGPEALAGIGAAWAPHRAVAARMLWHYYLSTRRRASADNAREGPA